MLQMTYAVKGRSNTSSKILYHDTLTSVVGTLSTVVKCSIWPALFQVNEVSAMARVLIFGWLVSV